ncbi:MAG: 2-hydroxyacyl-CoA dehydratase [Syntrophales bacterium]|jgi:benzoyl-CoA reductase/2-hydroxyglutaryl-CoA dehydratase subunit BcrC/BadD/HgdB|nr:2-hydroxyacyl-CoA dehydratase [Syntrophales bacterium]MCK9527392.1 2-hydroxyacyl-CoA dehydratase [Syntrophales bacterium]MDX9921494.1 2-hydroxyacyl-CoA dehydratase [Syntrophales bacterium]
MTPPVESPEKKAPPIAMNSRMKEIMTHYYIDAKTAGERGVPVAWITSGGPVEPLIAMDIIPVYPENHGAMIGASKMGADLCERAEAMGYSGDLCSYARSDIACATINGGPIGGLPRPDMLIACNNICGTVVKWYETLSRYFDVPLFIFDTPICHTDYHEESKRYVTRQVSEYIEFLERASGRKLDRDTMTEVGGRSLEAQRLWQSVLDTAAARPSPMTAFDGFYHLALIVTLRGTQVAVDYYRDLLAEMKNRVAEGIGAVPNERYRLMWDNLPIWYRLKWLSKKFAAHDAALVADTYTTAWCRSVRFIDEQDFLGSIAEGYTRIYLNLGVDRMADAVVEMAEKYSVHGLVMHSNRSCKPYSFGQYDIERTVRDRLGIPCLLIESHMVDERSFSEAQTETRIDAFMEVVRQQYG